MKGYNIKLKDNKDACRDRSKGQNLESLESETRQQNSLKVYIVNMQVSTVNVQGGKRGLQEARSFSLCSSAGEMIQAQINAQEYKRTKFQYIFNEFMS